MVIHRFNVGLGLILFQLFVMIGWIMDKNIFVNRYNASKRILLSTHAKAILTEREQLYVQNIVLHIERMTDEKKHVFMEYSNIIKRMIEQKDMNYHEASMDKSKAGTDELLIILDITIKEILGRATYTERPLFRSITNIALLSEFREILELLVSADKSHYEALATRMLVVMKQFAENELTANNLDNFESIIIKHLDHFRQIPDAKSKEEFKEILRDMLGEKSLPSSQDWQFCIITYKRIARNQEIDDDGLNQLFESIWPIDDTNRSQIKEFYEAVNDAADTPAKREALMRLGTFMESIELSDIDTPTFINQFSGIYDEIQETDDASFLLDMIQLQIYYHFLL